MLPVVWTVLNAANGSITIEIEVEVGFKGKSSAGIGINPVLAADIVPIAIEIPGVQTVGSFVLQRTVFTPFTSAAARVSQPP